MPRKRPKVDDIFLDKVKNVERHLIVAAPRYIRELIVNESRHDVNVLLEYRGRIDLEDCVSRKAR